MFHQVHVIIEPGRVRRRIVRWRPPGAPLQVAIRRVRAGLPGVCCRCGCSDLEACPGSCFWVNSEHTLCSCCAVRAVVEVAYRQLRRHMPSTSKLMQIKEHV